MTCNGDCNQGRECICECKKETNMVTVPLDKLKDMQRRLKTKQWQGLSDDELEQAFVRNLSDYEYGRAIEAKLKEKNEK